MTTSLVSIYRRIYDDGSHPIRQTEDREELVRSDSSVVEKVEDDNPNTGTRVGNSNIWTRISNTTPKPTRCPSKDKKAKHQGTAGAASARDAYQCQNTAVNTT